MSITDMVLSCALTYLLQANYGSQISSGVRHLTVPAFIFYLHQEGAFKDSEIEEEVEESEGESEEEELPPPAPLDTNVNFSIIEHVLLSITPQSWKLNQKQLADQREEMINNLPLFYVNEDGEQVREKVTVFFEDTEEVRAEPELGGLGPGLTGEHTLYSFCVGHTGKYGERKWKMKKRFSQFFAFDAHVSAYLRQVCRSKQPVPVLNCRCCTTGRLALPSIADSELNVYSHNHIFQIGIEIDRLPVFPEKQIFGSMSPKLVRERKEQLEFYFKELCKDREIMRCVPLLLLFAAISPPLACSHRRVEQSCMNEDRVCVTCGYMLASHCVVSYVFV